MSSDFQCFSTLGVQPSSQKKYWQFMFLQTTDMLRVHLTGDSASCCDDVVLWVWLPVRQKNREFCALHLEVLGYKYRKSARQAWHVANRSIPGNALICTMLCYEIMWQKVKGTGSSLTCCTRSNWRRTDSELWLGKCDWYFSASNLFKFSKMLV